MKKGWRIDEGPLPGRIRLYRGTTCIWGEKVKGRAIWIAADWVESPDGSSYRWGQHREYPSLTSALEGEG